MKRYLLGALVILAFVVGYLSLPRAPRPSKPETLSSLSQEVGVTFPPSARLVGVRRSSGMDDRVAFKLLMNSDEMPAFLNAAQVDAGSMSSGALAYFGGDREFWDPHQAQAFRGVQLRREKTFRTLNIGVTEAKDGLAAVYIVEHGD